MWCAVPCWSIAFSVRYDLLKTILYLEQYIYSIKLFQNQFGVLEWNGCCKWSHLLLRLPQCQALPNSATRFWFDFSNVYKNYIAWKTIYICIAGPIPQLSMVSDKWNLYLHAIFGSFTGLSWHIICLMMVVFFTRLEQLHCLDLTKPVHYILYGLIHVHDCPSYSSIDILW